MKELDELVKCKACQEKENMIQTLDNKIRHMEKNFTKNQEKWVDVFQTLGEETEENRCSK